jgi:hypothetical protein
MSYPPCSGVYELHPTQLLKKHLFSWSTVLPVEITHEAPRITAYDEATSTDALQDDVDHLMKQEMSRSPELLSISKICEITTAVEFVHDLLC